MKTPASPHGGLVAIRAEMDRQHGDALASFQSTGDIADRVATAISATGKVLLLGMGASHSVGRAVEPLYRDLGIEAIALPLSEQLEQPLPLAGRTVLVTSQSGESAEVVRWFDETRDSADFFGMTMEGGSSLARAARCLVGAGGSEHAFAATRSLTVTVALHAAVLARLGAPMKSAVDILANPPIAVIEDALDAMRTVDTIVTSARRLQGVAEAIALGLTELSRLPCFSLEGGQFRHGPMEMLGPDIGVVMFRGSDATSGLVAGLARKVVETSAPTVIFDSSGEEPVAGAVTVTLPPAADMAALFTMLPAAQLFMVEFAASRVENVGTPIRSQKVTRIE